VVTTPAPSSDHDLLITIATKVDMLLVQIGERDKFEDKVHDEIQVKYTEQTRLSENTHSRLQSEIRILELRVVRLSTISGLAGALGGTAFSVILSLILQRTIG
jgi:hypothetical protein